MPPLRSQMQNGMRMARGRGMMNSNRPMSMTPPHKRMYENGSPGMPPMKRARMARPPNQQHMNMNRQSNVGPLSAMCRVCGNQHQFNLKLQERPEFIKMIDFVLNLN